MTSLLAQLTRTVKKLGVTHLLTSTHTWGTLYMVRAPPSPTRRVTALWEDRGPMGSSCPASAYQHWLGTVDLASYLASISSPLAVQQERPLSFASICHCFVLLLSLLRAQKGKLVSQNPNTEARMIPLYKRNRGKGVPILKEPSRPWHSGQRQKTKTAAL